MVGLLSLQGCESFKVKFNPQEAAWAEQKGDKTLILHGYMIDIKHKKKSCDELARNAVIQPDTPYYREWIRVVDSPWRFKSSVDKSSQDFGRIAPYQQGCVFTFTDLPPGKWLIMMAMQHHIAPTPFFINNRPAGRTDISDIYSAWASIEIKPEYTVIKKNVVLNKDRKEKNVPQSEGLNYPEAHLLDWTPEEDASLHFSIIPSMSTKDYNHKKAKSR
ncbi:hypothetical protein [Komagataeibacter xylinus]|uniref:Uncharacterized protein n=1 Tax=Komagataeibacter xylinus TaxID=28448 RepID=A0A857FSI7_KOMXY|nr:hypothetical protein [Komagataeibacter xylinus]QHC36499.1 hypothetical protein FMA36_14210 [Komagataeibacter xylinus]